MFRVILNGCGVEKLQFERDIRKVYNLSKEVFLFVCVGNISRNKMITHFCRSLVVVRNKGLWDRRVEGFYQICACEIFYSSVIGHCGVDCFVSSVSHVVVVGRIREWMETNTVFVYIGFLGCFVWFYRGIVFRRETNKPAFLFNIIGKHCLHIYNILLCREIWLTGNLCFYVSRLFPYLAVSTIDHNQIYQYRITYMVFYFLVPCVNWGSILCD